MSESEHYGIIEIGHGPPSASCSGLRVQARLSGCPSRSWSGDVSARFAGELGGHPAAQHIRIIERNIIAVDRVQTTDVPIVISALKRSVHATNQALHSRSATAKVTQEHASPDQPAPPTRYVPPREQFARNLGETITRNGWFG